MHGLDSGAVDLRHVRGVDERERNDPVHDRRLVRDEAELEARDAEADDERDDDDRRAAEEVGVGDRQGAKRQGSAPRQTADDGEREREHQDQGLRDDHHLDVHLEPRPDVRQRQPEAVRVEEGVKDLAKSVHAASAMRGSS